jgi:hypothetical protein
VPRDALEALHQAGQVPHVEGLQAHEQDAGVEDSRVELIGRAEDGRQDVVRVAPVAKLDHVVEAGLLHETTGLGEEVSETEFVEGLLQVRWER